ncbi:MAG: hypothetical protein GQE15_02715 [Archangiaceae bacterium]|nr:hypothetical protein [Archangiaceae bacterium]
MRLAVVIMLVMSCGVAAPSTPTRVDLTQSSWVFRFITAAHCNDWSRTLSFSTDGGVASSLERNVLTPTHECSRPVLTEHGTWRADERHVSVAAGDTVWRAQLATSAAPRLNRSAGTITASPLSLTTRAFLRRGDAWVDEHEATKGGQHLWTRTTVVVSGEPTCAMRVTVEVDVDGATASETFTPPCTSLVDRQSGWRAFGDLERFIYRHDLVRAAGVFERHAPVIANAIVDGVVLALVIDDARPELAVHPASSDEALGWYDALP